MANLPPVKLETHTTWFNLLLTLLREHAQNNPYEEYRQMAQRLFSSVSMISGSYSGLTAQRGMDWGKFPSWVSEMSK